MDTRVGFPNEHLANSEEKDIPSPMFATAVGLILRGWDEGKYNDGNNNLEEEITSDVVDEETEPNRKINNIFKNWAEKFLRFLSDEENETQNHDNVS